MRGTVAGFANVSVPTARGSNVTMRINSELAVERYPQCVSRYPGDLNSSSEPALLVVPVCLLDFVAGIHDERSAARNRLVEWLAGHDQETCVRVGSL
jgi:hypothetical protein